MATKNTVSGEGFKLFEWIIAFKKEHGVINIITAGLLLIFMSMVLTLVFNPNIIFDKYREYDELRHTESFNRRMKANKAMQLELKDIVSNMRAYRGFVIELHNGKVNSTGLSFNYGGMTYEALGSDTIISVAEDYADFTLDRYPILMKVYDEGYWCGTTDDLAKLDKRMALRLESNNAYGIVLTTIYGVKSEIGFLGITYNEMPPNIKVDGTANLMRKYAAQIAPLLDGDAD